MLSIQSSFKEDSAIPIASARLGYNRIYMPGQGERGVSGIGNAIQLKVLANCVGRICKIEVNLGSVGFAYSTIVFNQQSATAAKGKDGAFDVEKCVREHEWMEGVNSHEIKVGDNLFSMTDAIMFDREDEVGLEVISIDENQEMTVHNLSGIEDNHNFFANGMLVHNFQEINPNFNPGFKP